jgi:hypothetical protein
VHVLDGLRYDLGDKTGYLQAVIDFALERDDLKSELVEYLTKPTCVGKRWRVMTRFVFKCHRRRLPLDSVDLQHHRYAKLMRGDIGLK